MAGRSSQVVGEVIGYNVPNVRASQTFIEVSGYAEANVRTSQLAAEVIWQPPGIVQVSQTVAEVIWQPLDIVRASQIIIEVIVPHGVYQSQMVTEVVIFSVPRQVPPIYPELKGLTPNTIRRLHPSVGIMQNQSGREVRIPYFSESMWEWELSYDYLPDAGIPDAGTFDSDVHALMGFFQSTYGGQYPFLYRDPDNCQTTGSYIGTTDGRRGNYQIFYSVIPSAGPTMTAAVGYVDTSQLFKVYLDNVLQSASSYEVLTHVWGNQQINFNGTPPAGKSITVDMSFLFFARFIDPVYSFEEFLSKIWLAKKITLASRRSYQ